MHKNKTQLLQQNIWDPLEANHVFNEEHGNTVPLVLIPADRWCCSCYYHIPSGVHTLVHTCGRDAYPDGIAPAGLQMCKPYWNRAAYMVTMQSCTYNAPVKSCPTKNNVMVDCELTLVFSIGPDTQQVKDFIYNLGAPKFNEFLAAECEESIRQLIRVTPLDEVYELRGSSCEHVQNVLKNLNDKFADFGVTFTKAVITDIVLNHELRTILQGTTEFKTKIKELEKEHEHNMKLIKYDYEKKLSEKMRVYERKIQDTEADIAVELVNRRREVVDAESRRDVAVTKSMENAAVVKQRANAQFNVATARAEMENEDLLAKAQSKAEASKIKVDKDTQVSILQSKQMINVSADKAQALKIEAEAEGSAAESLRVIREHNLEMAKLEVTEAIAKKAKMVICGKNGEELLSSIVDKSLLGKICL